MTAAALAGQVLNRVQGKGAVLTVLPGGRLNVEAPPGVLTPADLEELRSLKPALLDLLMSPPGLLVEGPPTCCSCEVALSPGRVYQCETCQNKHEPPLSPRGAHLAADGSLRIPCYAPTVFRWWAGGQSPLVTALALGMPEGQAVARYGRPTSGPGIWRKRQ